jgi:septal ring factor EnvC (AmiA/AmiB activator)
MSAVHFGQQSNEALNATLPPLSHHRSAVSQQVTATAAAVGVLSERLSVLQAYLVAVKHGDVPADHGLLRQIAAVAFQVPDKPDPALLVQLSKVGRCPASSPAGTQGIPIFLEIGHSPAGSQ